MIQWILRAADRIRTWWKRSPVVVSAHRLLRAGQGREAIDLLTDAFESTHNADIAVELVRLRHEVATQGIFPPPREDWPPDVPDLFVDCVGTPEIDADELTGDALASGILHHGALRVRGLLPQAEVERFASYLRNAYAARSRRQQGTLLADDKLWYEPIRCHSDPGVLGEARRFVEEGAGLLGADSPVAVHEVLRMAESRGVIEAVESFLGERPAVSVRKTTLRIVPPDTATGWHQDGAFLGDYVRSVNMWIALSRCGADAPSLDMIPMRFDHIVETGTEGTPLSWAVGDAVAERVAREAGTEILHLEFEPGDAIFFDHMNLHRTGVRPGMTQERLAIEWWFFAPSRFPKEQIPLLA